jgi:Ca2+-dependent lipid-binding protein
MTISLLRNLAFGFATLAFAACTSSQNSSDTSGERTNEVSTSDNTAKANMKEGWEDVKQGTEQAATGVGQKTKEVAREVSADIKEAGNEVKASACPVVANRTTKRYYTQTNRDYDTMLKGEKILSADNRECFMSERAALDDGYTKAR